jgi:C-terminal processing protease CtpA/Prc
MVSFIYQNSTLILKIKTVEMQERYRIRSEPIEKSWSGIVLDVRDDGGGSLSTVVDIAGLFIEQGPYCSNKICGY